MSFAEPDRANRPCANNRNRKTRQHTDDTDLITASGCHDACTWWSNFLLGPHLEVYNASLGGDMDLKSNGYFCVAHEVFFRLQACISGLPSPQADGATSNLAGF